MALEALRDVFLQAGQDYAKRVRQDELLAQERARQDELYTKQRADTVSDMNRRTSEQKDSENRAYARVKETEEREITNAIKRVDALGKAEASMVKRKAVYMSGKPDALNPEKMDDATVSALYDEAIKKNSIREATNAEAAQIEARKTNLKALTALNKEQNAEALTSERSRYERNSVELAANNRKIEERSKSGGLDAKVAVDKYYAALAAEVDQITGGNREEYIKNNFPKAKGKVTNADILMSSTSYPLFLQRMKDEAALDKNRDPLITSLLTEQQSLLANRNDSMQKLAALKFDFSTLSSATAPADEPATAAAAPTGTPTPRGTPTAAALRAVLDNPGAQTPANPGSPSVGVPANERDAGGGDDTGNFFPNRAPDAPSAPAPAAAPTPVAAPANTAAPATDVSANAPSSGPSFFNKAGDFISDNPGTVAAGTVAALARPGVLDGAAGAVKGAAGYLTRGAQSLSGVPSAVGNAIGDKLEKDALANTAKKIGLRNAIGSSALKLGGVVAGTLGRGYLAGQFMNTAVPVATDAFGLTNTKEIYGDRTPNASEIIADAYLAMTATEKPKTFGDEFVLKLKAIASVNIPEGERTQLRDALIAFRDQKVREGFTYDSPAASIDTRYFNQDQRNIRAKQIGNARPELELPQNMSEQAQPYLTPLTSEFGSDNGYFSGRRTRSV